MDLLAPIRKFDRFQQRIRPLAFAVSVMKKFSEDRAASLAALIAYYGFFSLFPLLLVFVTVLGFVLEGDPSAQQQILNSTLAQLPVIGEQLQVRSLEGSGLALAIGIVASLLAGIAITEETQNAFAAVWAVPVKRRPNYLQRRLRGLAMLVALGVLNIASAVGSQLASVIGGGFVGAAVAIICAAVVNVGLFFAAFRLLTPREIATADLVLGACIAAIAWTALEAIGGYLVSHVLTRQRGTYGVFALVIGLLSWLYLGAQVTLYASEINVVRARGLWPRSLFSSAAPADRKTLRSLAQMQQRVEGERIDVRFKEEKKGPPEGDQPG